MVEPAAIARWFRVDPAEACPLDDLDAVVRAFVPAGDLVALAEPTDPAVAEAVLRSGARYIDVGRTARMRVHPDGWRYALDEPRVRLGWLLSPDEPTMTTPPPSLRRLAEARGLTVVLDERFSPSPGGPVTLHPGVVRLRALTWNPKGRPLHAVALAPAETLLAVRRHARWTSRLPKLPPRVWPWVLPRTPQLPHVLAATRTGVSMRMAGVPSADIAARLGLPGAGSAHWSWRDTVRLWVWDLLREDGG